MRIGPLFVGWEPLDESDRIELGLDACLQGWEALHVEWNGSGFVIVARPREGRQL